MLLTITGISANAQQSNFQISPAPISYPFFEPQRKDIKLTGVYAGITGTDVEISGYGFNGVLRHAVSENLAFDGTLGMTALNGMFSLACVTPNLHC